MKAELFIKDSVVIRNGMVLRNGEELDSIEISKDLAGFLKNIFKGLNLKYPKFYKMDNLSKLAFLAMEILYSGEKADEETALVFGNSASSLDTDEQYLKTINEFPSPSLFVYTLPNIMLGELSIRHQLKTENIFFVQQNFDPALFTSYTNDLFLRPNTNEAVCGWVDLHNSEYDVFLCRITRSGQTSFNEEKLQKLYFATHE